MRKVVHIWFAKIQTRVHEYVQANIHTYIIYIYITYTPAFMGVHVHARTHATLSGSISSSTC